MSKLLACKNCGKEPHYLWTNPPFFYAALVCVKCEKEIGIENHHSMQKLPDSKELEKQWNEANAK